MTDNTERKSQEDEVFEFLNSLPEEKGKADVPKADTKTDGKGDQDILDFLNELEASDKSKPMEPKKAEKAEEVPEKKTEETHAETAAPAHPNPEVNDPITSISNWWTGGGSARVSSQLSSLWGTAQAIGEEAQKQADSAIKKVREQGMEERLRAGFRDLGITGPLEGKELTAHEREQLLKLPDTRQALESLNKGIGKFSSQLTGVLEKINSHDETLDIELVHDLKNYPSLSGFVKHNFEDVMNSQVDGRIQVNVAQSGTKTVGTLTGSEKRDMGLFQGKLSDADRLVQANIESIIKGTHGEKTSDGPDGRVTEMYIGLLAVSKSESPAKSDDDEAKDEESTIVVDENSASSFCYTATLVDKTNRIVITTRSQPFPLKWCRWLDGEVDKSDDEIDPSAWVIDWVEQGLDSMLGVLAQSYVIKRMGY